MTTADGHNFWYRKIVFEPHLRHTGMNINDFLAVQGITIEVATVVGRLGSRSRSLWIVPRFLLGYKVPSSIPSKCPGQNTT